MFYSIVNSDRVPRPSRVQVARHRRGTMMILMLTAFIMLFVAAVIGIDVAFMHVTRAELRTATDAAARAGVEALGRTQNINAARQAAVEYAARNTVAGAPLRLSPSDVEIGSTVGGGGNRFTFRPGGNRPNAIRIRGRRTADSPSGSIPLFFGPRFGQSAFQPEHVATAARLDLDVSLVLDVSGSMSVQNRFPGLVNAVRVFIQELEQTQQEERLSMTVYSTNASKAVAMTSNLQSVNTALSRFRPNGMTAIGRGMQVGLSTFRDPQARPFALRAMIVMTDGQHNTGIHPFNVVSDVFNQNVTVHTVTFSRGANQGVMREVARRGGGIHVHADNNADLVQAFREIARQLALVLVE